MLNSLMNTTRRMAYGLIIIGLTLALYAAAADAGTATVAWSAPTTNADGTAITNLAGYKVYYGTAPATYGTALDAKLATTYQIDALADGATYYFNVTAYNTAGIESSFSGEISKAMPRPTYTLSATTGTNGTITPAGNQSVNYGANQTYTITPVAGYHVSNVLVDGVSAGVITSYTFTNVTANHTISASFAVNTTFAITASVSGNATLSPAGVVAVSTGASQTFTITPNTGYTVSSVVVDGVSVGAVTAYTFSKVTANHTLVATIKTKTYKITPSAGTGGTISPSAALYVAFGGSKTFTITPNTGYHIANVVVDGVSVGAVATYTFMNLSAKAHTISAEFAVNTYTINTGAAGNGGSLSPTGILTVSYGGNGVFTIQPDAGYHVADVLVDGISAGPVTSYTFTNISANHTISASFAINTYTIMTMTRGAGAIAPAGLVTANYGGNAVFSISADAGNVITDVLVDGASVGRVKSLTFTNITANHSIEAVIAANLSCPDTGIPCVERIDGQPDGNNLVNGSPKMDVVFEFRAIIADENGSPRSVQLALTQKADPVATDFTRYDMTCTGDFSTGALCTYRTELPPTAQQKFTIEAVLSDGTIATISSEGTITGPQIDLLTSATFTVALRAGWNCITNPYQKNIDLSSVLVQKGSAVPIPWLTATGNNWLSNALYDFTGSDATRTSLADHAGSTPDAVLLPWRTYWVYLNNADAAYSLIFTKPLSNVAGQ